MAQRKLLMIPGPIEFDKDVLSTLGEPSPSHVAPNFMEEFSETLKLLREILFADNDCQPFILSGGGALGWDCIVSSLCDSTANDRALILNTGYFSDNFAQCCHNYGIECDQIYACEPGDIISPEMLSKHFENNENINYKLICITHVDTSTAIVNQISKLSEVIDKYCDKNNTLIAVDGVCSFAGERFYFSKWGIDACMTASQKAFGCPPGLSILMLSNKAINIMKNRKSKINSFYTNLMNWLPIMEKYEAKQASYFSTPNVNLIRALHCSCKKLKSQGMENVFNQHLLISNAFKDAMEKLGLTFVAKKREYMAHTLTAVRYPPNVNGGELLKHIKEYGVILAGGLHRDIKSEYFRVGHMGISVNPGCDHILTTTKAIEYGLNKVGYKFKANAGVNTILEQVKLTNNSETMKPVNKKFAHGQQVQTILGTICGVTVGFAVGYLVSTKRQK